MQSLDHKIINEKLNEIYILYDQIIAKYVTWILQKRKICTIVRIIFRIHDTCAAEQSMNSIEFLQ